MQRITAVTGDVAAEVTRRPDAFDARLDVAAYLRGGALEPAAKQLSAELTELTISAVQKAGFQERVAKLGKAVVAWKKEQAAVKAGKVMCELVELATAAHGPAIVL